MIAEFVGEESVLHDWDWNSYVLVPGAICSIDVSGFRRGRVSLSILTPDGHMLECPYDSLDAICRNWRRCDA